MQSKVSRLTKIKFVDENFMYLYGKVMILLVNILQNDHIKLYYIKLTKGAEM